VTQRWETFGDLLRHLRAAAGITQEELAERAGLSVRGVSDLERGRNRFPYRATVLRLVEVLAPTEEEIAALWALASRRTHPGGEASIMPRVRLPTPLTGILGREAEQEHLLHLLRWQGVRFLTITGAGGVGKTRLALHVAAESASDYADGVTFVSLAALDDPRLVPGAIVAALGLPSTATIATEEALSAHLAGREHLLLIDNAEQVAEAGTFLASLLGACPRVKALVTSRVPLHIRGEQQFALAPLPVLPRREHMTEDDLATAPATALFLERARSAVASLSLSPDDAATVAEICRRLDGLPLAIELAAVGVKHESPRVLLASLDRSLDILASDSQEVPARQRTLRATIDWSYQLLSPEAQALVRRLAAFAGGTSVDTLVATGQEGELVVRRALRALHDASLVLLDSSSGTDMRVHMLETVRRYARDALLADPRREEILDRHLAYFVGLAEEAGPFLTGPEQVAWIDRLAVERDNLLAALTWAAELHRVTQGLRLLIASRVFWDATGLLREAIRHMERLLAANAVEPVDSALRARALGTLGRWEWARADPVRGRARVVEGLALLEGNMDDPTARVTLLNTLAGITHDSGDLPEAMRLYRTALEAALACDDRWQIAAIHTNLGNLLGDLGDLDAARHHLHEGLTVLHALGERRIVGMNLNVLGEVHRLVGARDEAERTFREAAQILHHARDLPNLAYSLECLARVARDRAALERAACLIGAAQRIRNEVDIPAAPDAADARDAVIADCERVLGSAEVVAAQSAGAAMSLDTVLAYALERPTAPGVG
jgi:predicted ATPase/DNA-binding XRE family transcriptional regulator